MKLYNRKDSIPPPENFYLVAFEGREGHKSFYIFLTKNYIKNDIISLIKYWEGNMSYSILIAEDDLSIAELMKMALVASGYDCKIATSGSAAKQYIDEYAFNLALLDIMLRSKIIPLFLFPVT